MPNQEGHTALYKASYHGQRGVVETLVNAKASVDGLSKVRTALGDRCHLQGFNALPQIATCNSFWKCICIENCQCVINVLHTEVSLSEVLHKVYMSLATMTHAALCSCACLIYLVFYVLELHQHYVCRAE